MTFNAYIRFVRCVLEIFGDDLFCQSVYVVDVQFDIILDMDLLTEHFDANNGHVIFVIFVDL